MFVGKNLIYIDRYIRVYFIGDKHIVCVCVFSRYKRVRNLMAHGDAR